MPPENRYRVGGGNSAPINLGKLFYRDCVFGIFEVFGKGIGGLKAFYRYLLFGLQISVKINGKTHARP